MKNIYVLLVTVIFIMTACEKEGDFETLHWSVSRKGVLTISGNGEIKNFRSSESKPWPVDVKKVVIKEGVTAIGDYAFGRLNDLASVSIPQSVKRIGYASFEECRLFEITIPSSVDYIDSWAFTKCSDLEIIIFEGPVETMGDNIFADWGFVRRGYVLEIKCPPFTVPSGFFDDFDFEKSYLIVPKGTKERFDTASGWQDFRHIIEK